MSRLTDVWNDTLPWRRRNVCRGSSISARPLRRVSVVGAQTARVGVLTVSYVRYQRRELGRFDAQWWPGHCRCVVMVLLLFVLVCNTSPVFFYRIHLFWYGYVIRKMSFVYYRSVSIKGCHGAQARIWTCLFSAIADLKYICFADLFESDSDVAFVLDSPHSSFSAVRH